MSNEDTPQCSPLVGYVSPFYRDTPTPDQISSKSLVLSPWTVQNICYEIAANYMLANDPREQGFVFSQRYHRDPKKSEVFLDLAYNYRDDVVQKRPAVFVSRGVVKYDHPTFNQQIGGDSRNSKKAKLSILEMPIVVTVVGTNVGFAEQFAQYLSRAYMDYAEEIRSDFFLRKFRLEEMTAPTLYLESKEHYAVSLNLYTAFDMGFTITGDHLKLKTVSFTVFTSCAESPLLNQ
jgi:hypothetical protein